MSATPPSPESTGPPQSLIDRTIQPIKEESSVDHVVQIINDEPMAPEHLQSSLDRPVQIIDGKPMKHASRAEEQLIDQTVQSIEDDMHDDMFEIVSPPLEVIDLTGDDCDLPMTGTRQSISERNPIKREPTDPVDIDADLRILPAIAAEDSIDLTDCRDGPLSSESVAVDELPEYSYTANPPDWQEDEQTNALESTLLIQKHGLDPNIADYGRAEQPQVTISREALNATAEEEADEAALAAEFKALKRAFDKKKKKTGRVSVAEDLKFKIAERAEKQRLRLFEKKKRLTDDQWNDPADDSLFFPETAGDYGVDEDMIDAGDLPDIRPTKTRNQKFNKIPVQELRDAQKIADDDFFREIRKSAPRKPRQPRCQSGGPGKKKKSALEPDSVGVYKAKKPPAKSRKKRVEDVRRGNILNADTLLNNDIIGDVHANYGKEGQYRFTSKNKKTALEDLITSMPKDQQDTAHATRKQLDQACKAFGCRGPGSMAADGKGGWRLKGMSTSLYSYQLLGAGWMRGRENANAAPFGGILADSMGLGKTLLSLSTIVDDMPAAKFGGCLPTLVVCPSSLCTQWLSEIRRHTEPDVVGEVIIYRPGSRIVSLDTIKTLSRCGIVITTYHEIIKSWPHAKPPPNLATYEAKKAWWDEYFPEHLGPVHKICWRRVILDEAQIIKNRCSRSFSSVCGLYAKYRWALTGTPCQNSRFELYSYFKFLKCNNIGKYDTFKQNFCTNMPKANERLDALLELTMCRRNHSNQIFGKPILSLPRLDKQDTVLEFNEIERAIYRIVKSRFLLKIHSWLEGGHIAKQFRNLFTLLLRLRQMCSHILLIQPTITELLETEDIEQLWQLTQREMSKSHQDRTKHTLAVLRQMLTKRKDLSPGVAEAGTEINPINPDLEEELDTGGSFGATYGFDKVLGNLAETGEWEKIVARSVCTICRMPAQDPYVTVPCNHLHCKECALARKSVARNNGNDETLCAECERPYNKLVPCKDIEEIFEAGKADLVRRGKRATKSADGEGNDLTWLELPEVLPSAKTLAVKAQVTSWLSESQEVKVLIFTQFTGMVKILGRVCESEGWGFCKFTGELSSDARDRAIADFRDNPENRIMLASMRCGSLGLNLMMASRVLILDPWWNSSVESQAFSRVYRIGQKSDVVIRRFVVKNTIDTDLLLRMQTRKDEDIADAMGDDGRRRNMTVEDLLRIFGPVQIDPATGLPILDDEEPEFIFIEDDLQDDRGDGSVPRSAPPPPFSP